MPQAGRPKISDLSRKEQLRRAKRAQRDRERQAGLVNVQLVLPQQTAAKLRALRTRPEFTQLLEAALDRVVIHLGDYPQLNDLAWNRTDDFIPAKEAFQLYERNWRFVDLDRLEPHERDLLDRLRVEYGSGVINA